jgi:hypothetical protein
MMDQLLTQAQRAYVGVVLPVALLVTVWVPWLLVRDDLPDPMAIHFDASGHADGTARVGALLVTGTLAALACAAVLVRSAWRSKASAAIPAGTAAFVGWTICVVDAVLLLANEGRSSWEQTTIGVGGVVGPVASAIGVSVPVGLIVRNLARAGAPLPPVRPIALSGTERPAWFGHGRSPVLVAIAVLTVASGAAYLVAIPEVPMAGIVGLACGLVVALFATVDVSVGANGLRVRPGGFHRPRIAIELGEIEAVRVVQANPLAWGGWGYRGGLGARGRSAWILRKGPALELELTGGRKFLVTVDGAAEAAAVLDGLLARTVPA